VITSVQGETPDHYIWRRRIENAREEVERLERKLEEARKRLMEARNEHEPTP
jgi:hypothetical protein